jgi:hypothetical protein
MEIPFWFFVVSLFVVMLAASYMCGKKLHDLQQERDKAIERAHKLEVRVLRAVDATRELKESCAKLTRPSLRKTLADRL